MAMNLPCRRDVLLGGGALLAGATSRQARAAGTVLRVSNRANPSSLDPMVGTSGDDHVSLYPIYATLVEWDYATLRPRPGIVETFARLPQAPPPPPSGSAQTAPSDPARLKTASGVSPRECAPGPSKPPFLEAQMTGHFTSYKHRTNHELATLMITSACATLGNYDDPHWHLANAPRLGARPKRQPAPNALWA